MRAVNLRGATLTEVDQSESCFSGKFQKSSKKYEISDLSETNLTKAKLVNAKMEKVDLSGADLIGTNLGGADLKGANLRGAKLKGTDFRKANLEGVELTFLQKWFAIID